MPRRSVRASLPPPAPKGRVSRDAACAVIASGPDSEAWIHDAYFAALAQARKRIWVTTPYFIPSPSLLMALRTDYFRPPYPASTGVVVPFLANPEAIFEIEVIAVLPEAGGGATRQHLDPPTISRSSIYSQVVRAGNLVFVAGQCAHEPTDGTPTRDHRIIGVGDPKKVSALEVWLFDKNDIQTITKVLMSAHAFNDAATRQRLASKGETILVEAGQRFLMETATLQLEARVVDMVYARDALPESSHFSRLTLEISVWNKM